MLDGSLFILLSAKSWKGLRQWAANCFLPRQFCHLSWLRRVEHNEKHFVQFSSDLYCPSRGFEIWRLMTDMEISKNDVCKMYRYVLL